MTKNNYLKKVSYLALLFAAGVKTTSAQQKPYYPTATEIAGNYRQADRIDSAVRNVFITTNIRARWQQDGNQFWYAKRVGQNATDYYLVNIKGGKKGKLFDTEKLAGATSSFLNKKIDADKFTITSMMVDPTGKHITYKTNGKWLSCDLNSYTCAAAIDTLERPYVSDTRLQRRRFRWESNRPDSVSPDGQWIATVKGGNIFVKSSKGGQPKQFTTNGSLEKPYEGVKWSPDSKYFVAYLTDPKEIKKVHYVLSSVEGTTRGVLRSRNYAQPGDEFTTYEQYIFNIASGKAIKPDADKIDFFDEPELHWRNNNSRYFTYEKADRGHQRFRVIEVDALTGKTKNIIDEKTNTFIYEQRIFTHYLPKTREIVWVTEKDGWRHIYLVNEAKGTQKLVTNGNWVVRDVDSVDMVKRQIWFTASGKNAAEDPYFIHYYRIGFDGKGLIDLTPEKGNHSLSFSPDRKYYIDTYSQVNIAPQIVLKQTQDGKPVLPLEKSDTKELEKIGLKLPEVFVAKGRDGKTDIWGVVYRPANMDKTRSYPIIENIYAGPQDSFVPKNFSAVNEMQSIAQLGFIVVQIDGMGTANRSKAFHDVCWKNLADAGFQDRILWMKALAKKYPEADTTRIGVYGTSAGGQNAAGALLFHPEFYKAGVAACGCHDNRIDKQWWNEQWMGYPVGPHYDQQSNITNASKLQGDLLLIVGEADENVPPESTLRFADALIKSNKMFDLLVVPGMGHSDGGPYGRKRKRDFFVKHLLNVDAPTTNHTTANTNSR